MGVRRRITKWQVDRLKKEEKKRETTLKAVIEIEKMQEEAGMKKGINYDDYMKDLDELEKQVLLRKKIKEKEEKLRSY